MNQQFPEQIAKTKQENTSYQKFLKRPSIALTPGALSQFSR
jgi:hypothetical protein